MSGGGEPAAVSPSITVTVEERTALQEHLLQTVGIGAVLEQVRGGELDRLAGEWFDGQCLVVDLGWDEVPSGVVELGLPRDDLLRTVFTVAERLAETHDSHPQRSLLVAQVCERVLAALEVPGGGEA